MDNTDAESNMERHRVAMANLIVQWSMEGTHGKSGAVVSFGDGHLSVLDRDGYCCAGRRM